MSRMCAEGGGHINDDNPGRPICRTCDDDPNVAALYPNVRTDSMKALMLTTAYDMLGDGQGDEWYRNTEYTRAVVDMVAHVIGLDERIVDRGGDERMPFVLGMIYAAHMLDGAR